MNAEQSKLLHNSLDPEHRWKKYQNLTEDELSKQLGPLSDDIIEAVEAREKDKIKFETALADYISQGEQSRYSTELLEQWIKKMYDETRTIENFSQFLDTHQKNLEKSEDYDTQMKMQNILFLLPTLDSRFKISVNAWYTQLDKPIPDYLEEPPVKIDGEVLKSQVIDNLVEVKPGGFSKVSATDKKFFNRPNLTRDDLDQIIAESGLRQKRLAYEFTNVGLNYDPDSIEYAEEMRKIRKAIDRETELFEWAQTEIIARGLTKFTDHWLFRKFTPKLERYVYNPMSFGVQKIAQFVKWLCSWFVQDNKKFRNGVGTMVCITIACSWIFDVPNPICVVIRYIASMWMWAVNKISPPPAPPPDIPTTLLQTIQRAWSDSSFSPNLSFLQSTYDVCIGYFDSGYTPVAMLGAIVVAIVGLMILLKYYRSNERSISSKETQIRVASLKIKPTKRQRQRVKNIEKNKHATFRSERKPRFDF